MLIGSIPPTGIPLPFMSAGGTSLMVFMGAVGILLNISKGDEQNFKFNVFTNLTINKKELKEAK
ncbi:MAG: FtsW/RodA/SpoVE family cell cycle protein [Clostridia bacterium]|nr:FtsW/RodA/SpoVE family cell cycle protein [Clostridia bacterium]